MKRRRIFFGSGDAFTRQITLAKAAGLLGMRRDDFSKLLKLVGLEYSYLSEEEIEQEKKISETL
ncbi:hypothetical protein CW714_05215 [Methanophagales archaeon]|nr:MAG: hypothetical protein CW714_05215 [Methanophagales archaeon]